MTSELKKIELIYVVLIILSAFMIITRVINIFSYSFDNEGLEQYFLHVVQRIMMHYPIYQNPEIFPFENCLYTPIYPYLLSMAMQLANIDPTIDIHKMYVFGRLITSVFIGIQFIYLYKLLSYYIASKKTMFILFLVFAMLLTGHLFSIRPDALKLLFYTLFLYYSIGYFYYKKSITNVIIASICAVAAIYTKQDAAIYICIALLSLIITASPIKKVILISFAIGISCLLIFGILYLMYDYAIISNLILFNLQTVKKTSQSYTIYFILLSIIRTLPLLLILLYNIIQLYKQKEYRNINGFIVISTCLTYIYAHFALLRAAASLNYLYELNVLFVMNMAIYIQNKGSEFSQRIRYHYLICCYIFFLFLTSIIFHTYLINIKKEKMLKVTYDVVTKEANTIKTRIGKQAIFLPNSKYMLLFADANMVTGHDMHIDRFIELYVDFDKIKIQSSLSKINTNVFDNSFLDGTIPYILMPNDSKSKPHLQTYYPKYKIDYHTSNFVLYKFFSNK